MGIMICGVGIDLIEVERVASSLHRFGDSFAARICGREELREWSGATDRTVSLAIRVAVKEACLKALGTGWAAGLGFSQIRLLQDDGGRHAVRLYGAAADLADGMNVSDVHVALDCEGGLASAVIVLVGQRCP